MAQIYFLKYKLLIDDGEETLNNVLNFRINEIPTLWRDEVIDLLTKEYEND